MHPLLQSARFAIALILLPATAVAQARASSSASQPRSDARLGFGATQVLEPQIYVRAVLDANPTIDAARNGWRAANARVRQAGGFDDPMISLRAAPLSIGTSGMPFGYEVGLSQRLRWFGQRALERDMMVAETTRLRSRRRRR